jgi:hypothetical protein
MASEIWSVRQRHSAAHVTWIEAEHVANKNERPEIRAWRKKPRPNFSLDRDVNIHGDKVAQRLKKNAAPKIFLGKHD